MICENKYCKFEFLLKSGQVVIFFSNQTGETHEVLHFNYTHWPDFGVPHTPLAFLNFLMAVRQSGALEEDVGPPVIHCSAGIGRSGTFCMADSALILVWYNYEKKSYVVSVFLYLQDLKQLLN